MSKLLVILCRNFIISRSLFFLITFPKPFYTIFVFLEEVFITMYDIIKEISNRGKRTSQKGMFFKGGYILIYYYDESFHDKSVTLKEQGLNITKENNFFFYIGAFLCFECEKEVSNSYSKLENDVKIIKRIRQQDELKGKNFKKNNFKNGFASFTDETSDFYYRFFDILHKDKTKFHLTFFNQYYLVFEPFIREIFSDIGMKKKYGIVKLKIMEKNFEYSFNKMIKEYNPFPLLECVFQELKYLYPKQILEQSKIFLNEILPYIKKIKKKEREYQAFNEILDILNKSNPSYKIIRENSVKHH